MNQKSRYATDLKLWLLEKKEFMQVLQVKNVGKKDLEKQPGMSMKKRVADSVRLAGSISDLRSEKMKYNTAVAALETENLLMKRL